MEASLVESPAFSAHASTCSASSATSCSAQTPRSSFRSDMPLTESEIEEGKVDLSIALAKSSLEQKEDEAVHHGQQNGLALTSRTRRTHGLGLDEELDREEEKADTFDAEPIGVAHNRASLERSTASASTTNSSLTSTQSFSRISSPAAPLAQHDIVSLLAPVSQTSNLSSPSRQPISPSNSIRASPLSKDLDRPKRGSLFGMSAFRSKKEKPISPLSAQSSQAQYKPSHASDTMSLRQGSSVASGSIRSRSSTDFGSQNRDSLPRFPASRNSMMQYQKKGEFLLKHQVLGPFTLLSKQSNWRPRFITLTTIDDTEAGGQAGLQHALHTYKSNQHNLLELDRLRLTKDSVICVTDEIADKKLYVLKVTGMVSAPDSMSTAPGSQGKGAWFFSMNDVPDLTAWMKLLKGLVVELRGESIPPSTPSTVSSKRSRRPTHHLDVSGDRTVSAHPFAAVSLADESLASYARDDYPSSASRSQPPERSIRPRRRADSHNSAQPHTSLKRYSFISTHSADDDLVYASSHLDQDEYNDLAVQSFEPPRHVSSPGFTSGIVARSPSLRKAPSSPAPSGPLPAPPSQSNSRPSTAESESKRVHRNSLYSAYSAETSASRSSNGSSGSRFTTGSANSSAPTSPSVHQTQLRAVLAPPPNCPLPEIPSYHKQPESPRRPSNSSVWTTGSVSLPSPVTSRRPSRAVGLDEETASIAEEDDFSDLNFPRPPSNRNMPTIRFAQ